MKNTTESTKGAVPKLSDLAHLSTFEKARLAGFSLIVLTTIGFAVLALGELFSLLALGWTAAVGAELGIHRLHVMVIATTILTTLLGVVVQVYRPTRQAASMVGAVIGVGFAAVVTVGVGESLGSILPFLVLISLAAVLHPAGRRVLTREQSYSPAMVALLVAAAVPLLAFSLGQLGLQTTATDPHAAAGHYTVMAQFGLVPLAYGIPAAMGLRGWRVAGWVAALPVAYQGVLSMSFTVQAGSTGVLWGGAAVLWAIGFVVLTEHSRVGGSPVARRSAVGQE